MNDEHLITVTENGEPVDITPVRAQTLAEILRPDTNSPDWSEEWERLPDRPTATSLPPDCERQLRALGAGLKVVGFPLAGPMHAAGVAGIMLAELYARGLVITERNVDA